MKTTTNKKTKWLAILLLAIGMFSLNAAQAFTASFTTTYGSGGAVTFTSTSTGTTSSTVYYWAPGNGSPVVSGRTLSTYNYTYPYNGTYTALLYISDTITNAFDSTFASVTVSNSSTCNLVSFFYGSYGTGGQVNFTSLSEDTNSGTTYNYNFGDGYSSTVKNPSHIYATNGYYYPTLTVSNGYGCTSTSTDTINMSTATGCNMTANYTANYGLNGRMNFTSTSTGVNQLTTLYTWNPGDGTGPINIYRTGAYEHTYLANGTYKVTLILNADSTPCTSTDTMDIHVTNVTVPCMLSANYTYTVNAAGQVSFASTSTHTNSSTQYYWNTGDGSGDVIGTSTLSHTYTIQGNYYVWLIVKDTGAAYCIDSIAQYVNVNTADSNRCGLHANFSYINGVNGHVYFSSPTYLQDSSFDTYNYTWNAGDGSGNYSSYDSVYNHIYTVNGTYTVSLIVTTNYPYDCKDSVSMPITISNVTVPCTLSAGFTVINDTTKGQVQFISTSTGTNAATKYYWRQTLSSPAVLGGSSYTTTYDSNGTYGTWLIIKDTGTAFCEDSVMETVNISNVDSLHASFSTVSNYDTIGNYNYEFLSTSTGVNNVTTYAWEPGDSTTGDTGVNLTTYYHTYRYSGAHTVTLSLWFSTYPRMGHQAEGVKTMYDFSTYSQTVYVGSPQGIATISETGSGIKLYPNPNNGEFKLAISGIADNKSAEVQITNMLGEVVCETGASVSNGTILKEINLQNVSTGTYFVRVITSGTVYNIKTVINR